MQRTAGGGGSGGRELPGAFGERDFMEYEFTDPVPDCQWKLGSELRECLGARDAGRQFIFRHWKARKKAYVEISLPSRYDPVAMHVFIEPDSSGRWRVIRIVEEGDNHFRHASGVTYRRATADERRTDASARRLVLLDDAGIELDSF
ncbi:MAG TPA: hypothetical protein VNA22_01635 [Pyrinomonadaceae bacterium]|nr:hypothetical protein [Pyrinomonadaceae bacterium]